jgi:hypothetical protein
MGSSPIQSTVHNNVHYNKEIRNETLHLHHACQPDRDDQHHGEHLMGVMMTSYQGMYITHTGTEVCITAESTGGGATDMLVFDHVHMGPKALNTMLEGKVITVRVDERGHSNIYTH